MDTRTKDFDTVKIGARLVTATGYQESTRSCSTWSKCRSRVASTSRCRKALAAIHKSFSGIGVPR
jgi:hypothetical protein